MAVEVRYLVIRDGKEVGMYTTKKEADAHDKMLDIAENISSFIGEAAHIDLDERQTEELSLHFAQHRDVVIKILKGSSLQKLSASPQKEEPGNPPPPKGKPARKPAKR